MRRSAARAAPRQSDIHPRYLVLLLILLLSLGAFSVVLTNNVPSAHAKSIVPATALAEVSGASSKAAPQSSREFSIENATSSVSTSNSSLGVQLLLQISTEDSGGNLSISLSAVNLRNTTNVISYADNWPYSQEELSGSDGCRFGASLAFGIFNGNLSVDELQESGPLPLYNTSVQFACTETFVATTLGPLGNESIGQSTAGYWTGGASTSSPAALVTFPPGNYTVVGEDEWGQILLLHFVEGTTTATSSGNNGTTTTTSTTSNAISSPSTTSSASQTTSSITTTSKSTATSISSFYLGVVAIVTAVITVAGTVARLPIRHKPPAYAML